jgi:hypothetical protein
MTDSPIPLLPLFEGAPGSLPAPDLALVVAIPAPVGPGGVVSPGGFH